VRACVRSHLYVYCVRVRAFALDVCRCNGLCELRLCTCEFVCVRVCALVCVCVCACVCVFVCARACVHTFAQKHVYMYVSICICI